MRDGPRRDPCRERGNSSSRCSKPTVAAVLTRFSDGVAEANERIDGIETGDPSDENDVVAVWALDLVPFRIVEGWLLVVNVSLALVTGRRWH